MTDSELASFLNLDDLRPAEIARILNKVTPKQREIYARWWEEEELRARIDAVERRRFRSLLLAPWELLAGWWRKWAA